MNQLIDIPVQDLSQIFDEIKVVKDQIYEAALAYSNALGILENAENYTGGAQEFLKVANGSMTAQLDKLSQYYTSCYSYILNVMVTFINVDEEIARKIYNEFLEIK